VNRYINLNLFDKSLGKENFRRANNSDNDDQNNSDSNFEEENEADR